MLDLFNKKITNTTKDILIRPVSEDSNFSIEATNVIISKNKRAKRISIRIKNNGKVRVTIPFRASFKSGEDFVASKNNWIFKILDKISKSENNINNKLKIIDENTGYETEHYKIKISRPENIFRVSLYRDSKIKDYDESNFNITLNFPANIDISKENSQKTIIKVLEQFFKIEAKRKIPEKVAFYESKFNIKSSKVTIRNSKTRWGSCSSKNSLNFSLHIMRLPKRLMNYLILHELAHITVKNHQKEFWNLLEMYCDGEAISDYEVISTYNSLKSNIISHIKLFPKTGRTHQLRIHLSKNKTPILGDKQYGIEGLILKDKGLFLSAVELNFVHPFTNKEMNIQISHPDKFDTYIAREKRRWKKYNLPPNP